MFERAGVQTFRNINVGSSPDFELDGRQGDQYLEPHDTDDDEIELPIEKLLPET